jgi:hypothetical protein
MQFIFSLKNGTTGELLQFRTETIDMLLSDYLEDKWPDFVSL